MARHKSRSGADRNTRLADQIRKDLAGIIQREIDVSRAGLITLTDVELSADYAHAKIWFTVMGAEPAVATEALTEKAGWFHSLLFKMLHIHTVPTLRFMHDDQIARGLALSRLIDEANRPQSPAASADSDLDDPDDPDEQP